MKNLFFLLILICFFSCNNISKQDNLKKDYNSHNDVLNIDTCKNKNLITLIRIVLGVKKIHGFSNDANTRNYDIIIANDLIPPGEKYEYEEAFDKISFSKSEIINQNLGGGIINFKSFEINSDTSKCEFIIQYFGDDGYVNMESHLNYEFDSNTCEWKSTQNKHIISN